MRISGITMGGNHVLHLKFSFLICFCQSRTNFSLTQNSRPAAQLFDSCANLTTCNLNFIFQYFIRFEDIFLNLETGEKQCSRDLVNNNLKHLQGFVFQLTCSSNVIAPFLIANNKNTQATAFARSLSYSSRSMKTKVWQQSSRRNVCSIDQKTQENSSPVGLCLSH